MDANVDIEVCLIVKRLDKNKGGFTYQTLNRVDKMDCMMVYGPCENIAGTYFYFVDWLDKNQLCTMASASRQVTTIDGQNTHNPEEYLTEIPISLIEI